MARLVVLAVLLATAAYAANEKKTLKVTNCSDTDCNTCESTAVEYKVDDDTCQDNGKSSYKAKCEKDAGWELKVYEGTGCNDNMINKTISTSGKCFHSNEGITAKVMSIATAATGTTGNKKYEVKVRVCEASTETKKCIAVDADDAKCPVKTIKVPTTNTECGRLDNNNKGFYYTAKKGSEDTDKPTKVTLKLYASAEDCEKEQLPVFMGVDMEAPEDTCKTFQQNLTATSCAGGNTLIVSKCTSDSCATCTGESTYAISSSTECQDSDSSDTGKSMHTATCGSNGGWTLKQYSGSDCANDGTDSVLTNSISAAGKCFTREMRAKLISIEEDNSNGHTVTVRVCTAADATKQHCTGDDNDKCPLKTITVPTGGKTCGPLDSTTDKGLYCTAQVVGDNKDKLTLAVYANKAECKSTTLPMFKGVKMEKEKCTTFTQNLTSTLCDTTALKLSTCTSATCETCDDAQTYTVDSNTPCQGDNNAKYTATCKADFSTGWSLETFSDETSCENSIYSISSTGQCFHKSMTAKVMSIATEATGTGTKKYEVKVRVCNAKKECSAVNTDNTNCPEKTIEVDTECGRLDPMGKGLYYTAKGDKTPNPTKVTLALYATNADCGAEKNPVFKGVEMVPPKDTCKTFNQKLNAVSCVTVAKPVEKPVEKKKTATITMASAASGGNTAAPATTAAGATTYDGDDNNTTTTDGSAAVSSVLALFLAACAVCMM